MKVVLLALLFFTILALAFIGIGFYIASLPIRAQELISLAASGACLCVLLGLVAFIAAKVVSL